MEQRSRSWSATRIKSRVWTKYLCLRLLKLTVLASVICFFYVYLHRYIYLYQQEWRPQRFLHLDQMRIEPFRPSIPSRYARVPHVCMDAYQGGLGNRMFQYAAVYVAATCANKTIKMSVQDAVNLPFKMQAQTYFFFQCQGQTLAERQPCAYDERLLMPPKTEQQDSTVLHGYWQSWKYFRHYVLDLRREFNFRSKIKETRDKFLEQFRNFTLIGVHIRRGDMLLEHNIEYGYQIPEEDYFYKAMYWFRKRFDDAIFIVCSNDVKYAKKTFEGQTDVFYSENHSPGEDLAILAGCEHVIMSVGTFGWWGAWLAGGQTIYYKHFARNGSEFEKDFVAEDFFPPTWIGME